MFVKMLPVIDKEKIKVGEIYFYAKNYVIVKEVNEKDVVLAHLTNLSHTIYLTAQKLAENPDLIMPCTIVLKSKTPPVEVSHKNQNQKSTQEATNAAYNDFDPYHFIISQDKDTFDKVIHQLGQTNAPFEEILKAYLQNNPNKQ